MGPPICSLKGPPCRPRSGSLWDGRPHHPPRSCRDDAGAAHEELERQLALRNKKLFGESSEKRPSDHSDENGERAAQAGHGPREQLGLQDVERVHELDDADRVCPQCGGELKPWFGQYEEAEEIDMLEQQYLRVQNKRQKYRCACGCIETALAPARLVPGGRYSVAFATASS